MFKVENIKQIHQNLISSTYGFDGIKDEAQLNKIVEDAEKIENLKEQAAFYLHSFVNKRPFIDKNRAMSILLFETILKDNAINVVFKDEELFNLVRDIQDGKTSIKDIVKLLNKKENFE